MQSTYFVTHSYLHNINFVNCILLYTTPIIQQLSKALQPYYINEIVTAMTQNTCSSYQYAAAIAD